MQSKRDPPNNTADECAEDTPPAASTADDGCGAAAWRNATEWYAERNGNAEAAVIVFNMTALERIYCALNEEAGLGIGQSKALLCNFFLPGMAWKWPTDGPGEVIELLRFDYDGNGV